MQRMLEEGRSLLYPFTYWSRAAVWPTLAKPCHSFLDCDRVDIEKQASVLDKIHLNCHLADLLSATRKMSNLHVVTSPSHFQTLLSADLERVSVLYFYADWAEPCASMTQAVAAMAEAYPSVLFLQIEAEALPEISESFEVDEVPYTILLRVS